MLSLMILTVLIGSFAILAAKNWRKTIGAGPTILIVGAIIVSLYGAVKWSDYLQHLRVYDSCVGRAERSQDVNVFDRALVAIIEREFEDQSAIVDELREFLVEPIEISSCGAEPSYFTEF